MKLQLNCATRNVTGSRHVLEVNGNRLLLDCGLYQGHRDKARAINSHFNFNPDRIDAVALSHAHIDHSGALPILVKTGFRGPIYATPATIDLAEIMLRDSAEIQMRDAEFINEHRRKTGAEKLIPLYDLHDVEATLRLFRPIDYEKTFSPAEGLNARFSDAGHIIGSSVTTYVITEKDRTVRLGFTGDLGRSGVPILRDPVPMEHLDVLLSESTYGDREHPAPEFMRETLRDIVKRVFHRDGKLVIPAFSVGRTQNILYFLQQLREAGKIPGQMIYIDSPLSVEATRVVEAHHECFDSAALRLANRNKGLFQLPELRYVTNVNDSIAINKQPGPCIIISASGMCESGRVLHHLAHTIHDPRNAILIVGWQAPHTLGRRIVEAEHRVHIMDRWYDVRAEILRLNGLSAHADGRELADYAAHSLNPGGKAILVHGELPECEALAARLDQRGIKNAHIPTDGEWVEL